ncbi:ComEC/Rec2 family competence protein [Pedobacter frigidisoli]|uniref:ComEC/Rec2 family competence protein n=1 Tax=Pedobacter frigidisoli TaxID=2530455 RepID=UPI00292D3E38|nr:ComEC/Rec2 family competence protein [Pedobacter frigidisoli]
MFKSEYIFVRILVPFVSGIPLFYFFPVLTVINWLSLCTFFLFVLILTLNITYKKFNVHRFKGISGILTLFFFFNLGGLISLWNNQQIRRDYFGKQTSTSVRIWVKDEPQRKGNILRFKAEVICAYQSRKRIKSTGQLMVALTIDTLHSINLDYGDELIISGRYLPVDPPYNPAEFDFKWWLASQNIYRQTFIDQNHMKILNRNCGNPVIRLALQIRKHQIIKYRSLIKNNEAFAVASTLILGFRADLDKETLNAYSKTGTIHALSVSGSHVAIIFFVLDFLLAFLDKKQWLSILKFVLICTLIWIYALITGLSPSVVRASIMISIFITAKTFARNKNAYNTLAFSAFCQLAYNPFLIWDVGFQLSYLSVLGLIYLQPKINSWVYIKNKWIDKIWELIALSLSAQLATFPLSVYYFHQFPVYFLLANLFISIPLILMMVLGLAVLFPFLNHISPLFEWVIVSTNTGLKWMSNLPYATVPVIWINLPELIFLCIGLILFILAFAKFKKKILAFGMIFYLTYSLMISYREWKIMQQKKIIFFSLRKNYAAAFITGRHTVLVTDLAAGDNIYLSAVKPALEQAYTNKTEFFKLNENIVRPYFIQKNHQIIFNKYRIMIIDECFNDKQIRGKAKLSCIWLTGNNQFDLQKLSKQIEYKNLVIDATNKEYKIVAFKAFAENNRVSSYILKKNPAYLINLTQ